MWLAGDRGQEGGRVGQGCRKPVTWSTCGHTPENFSVHRASGESKRKESKGERGKERRKGERGKERKKRKIKRKRKEKEEREKNIQNWIKNTNMNCIDNLAIKTGK